MPSARKTFRSAFVLDAQKLNRTVDAIKTRFAQAKIPAHVEFHVDLKGERHIVTSKMEDVLDIDNTEKSRIEELKIRCADKEIDDTIPDTYIAVHFDGTEPADIDVVAGGEDTSWVNDSVSAVEEQVERTLQKSFFHRLSYRDTPITILISLLALLISLPLGIALSSITPTKLTNRMWLTPADLDRLEQTTSQGKLTPEQAAEVLTYQIRNIVQASKERSSLLARLTHWRTILATAPFLVMLGAIGYLYLKCYPHAVFLWGDAEEWYSNIQSRRSAIWTTLVIAFAVGVLANLFVIALRP
jgi:hypothetical protein